MADSTVTKLPTQPERIPISFQLGDKLIDNASVKPLMFQAFTEHVAEAQTLRQPKTWEGRIKRVRMVRQVTYYSGGSPVTAIATFGGCLSWARRPSCKVQRRRVQTRGSKIF